MRSVCDLWIKDGGATHINIAQGVPLPAIIKCLNDGLMWAITEQVKSQIIDQTKAPIIDPNTNRPVVHLKEEPKGN